MHFGIISLFCLHFIKVAQAAPDPFIAKRARMEREKHGKGKRQKLNDTDLSQEERLKMSTAPYWNIPYPEQVCIYFVALLLK